MSDAKPRRLQLIHEWTVYQGRSDLGPVWINLASPTYRVAVTA